MALSRKQALRRLQGLEDAVLWHLDEHIPKEIGNAPEAVAYWRQEVNGFLDEMQRLSEYTGARTAAEWQAKITLMRQRLIALLGEGE
jgi:hypothetical protein